MSSISTSLLYGKKKFECHFQQRNAIVDLNVSDKEEGNNDIRD